METNTSYTLCFSGRPEVKNHLEDLVADGRIILKCILEQVGWRGMDLIDMAEDSDSWWSVVNAVMNVRVPETAGNFLTS
jgi:hypothetical protein